MKYKQLLLLTGVLLFSLVQATESSVKFTVKPSEYDFGQFDSKLDYVEHTFYLFNNSEKDIIIKDVRGNCGCIAADWEKRPIRANDSLKINILYRNWSTGTFHKKIKILTNQGSQSVTVKGVSIRRHR